MTCLGTLAVFSATAEATTSCDLGVHTQECFGCSATSGPQSSAGCTSSAVSCEAGIWWTPNQQCVYTAYSTEGPIADITGLHADCLQYKKQSAQPCACEGWSWE